MIKDIVKDEEFLSKPSEAATLEDTPIAKDLIDTIESLKDECACLAANQIGETKAIIAYQDEKDRIHVMYNPKIKHGIKQYMAQEGCMSREDTSYVARYKIVTVTYEVFVGGKLEKRERRFNDWIAQLIQHGVDHCNGELV